MRPKLTFGLYALESSRNLGALLNTLCDWLGEVLDADIACDETLDYQTLALRVRTGEIDIAWLPPIVMLRAGDDITPVASLRRSARGGYETALVVRDDSRFQAITDLRDAKAAWVDAWSAAGYVIPRLRLHQNGVDLGAMFNEEHFYGTHSAAVRAVVDGEADIAGTYAHVDASGKVVEGPWSQIADAKVRVLVTFGEIPADVFAVTPTITEPMRAKLTAALMSAHEDEGRRTMLKQLFGAEGFGPIDAASYDGLRAALSLPAKLDESGPLSKA